MIFVAISQIGKKQTRWTSDQPSKNHNRACIHQRGCFMREEHHPPFFQIHNAVQVPSHKPRLR